MSLVKILLPLCLWLLSACKGETFPEVSTLSGMVRGRTLSALEDRTVDVFLGIPYGAPTNGRNRFMPPKEVEPWQNVFDASKFSGPCFQAIRKEFKDAMLWVSKGEETEDCLKLNIWVPRPRPTNGAVMVWIHGGGFAVGSADLALYNGAELAAHEDVIVVTINYRLSAFGFLYLAHPRAPGNVGLSDQTLALQWVGKNIKAFGGNPEGVTIFGQSAGGASVHFHLMSPFSLDLFQNAIVQSGSLESAWAYSSADSALSNGLLLAERAGCSVKEDEREETIRCLQDLSNQKLLEVALEVEHQSISVKFGPVDDGTYLTASPRDLLAEGKFCKDKNVLIGYTREDGSCIIPMWTPHLIKPEGSAYTEDDLQEIISKARNIPGKFADLKLEITKYIYTDWEHPASNVSSPVSRIVHFATDRTFGCPVTTTAQKMAVGGNRVFFYRFDHITKKPQNPRPSWFGAMHGDELPFLFGHVLKAGAETTLEEQKLSKQIMRYFTNFARTGDPNDAYLPKWPKHTSENRKWIHLDGSGITEGEVQRLRECAFWETVVPRIHGL